MENAAKALLIAGGVLIAILVLTIGVYLVNRYKNTSNEYVTELDSIELQKYNALFVVYSNRKDISAQEIVTAVSIAKQRNLGTKVFVNGIDIIEKYKTDEEIENWKNQFLAENILREEPNTGKILNTFSCDEKSIKRDEYGKINEIKFRKN